MTEKRRITATIRNPGYLSDHRFLGEAVFPAVQALNLLAEAVESEFSDCDPKCSANAAFMRFLPVPQAGSSINAAVDLLWQDNRQVQASLLSSSTHAGITRSKEHVRANFGGVETPLLPPLDRLASLEGLCTTIPAEKVYGDMVPFGPAFHNAVGEVRVSADGVLANVRAATWTAGPYPLGSPFPFDAGMHLCCVHGQCLHRVVGFPVGYRQRHIIDPIRPGETVICRVFSRPSEGSSLLFDLYLLGEQGQVREIVLGLEMVDLSKGKLMPPSWLPATGSADLAPLIDGLDGMVIVELATVQPFALQALSGREVERFWRLGPRRRASYLAARLALKRLARHLAADEQSPAGEIETLAEDGVLPQCPDWRGEVRRHASAAHDGRLAVAVAGRQRVGVDVEPMGQKALRGLKIFASQAERNLVEASQLGDSLAALTLWTIKEAAAKTFGMDLPVAWRMVQVSDIGDRESLYQIDAKIFRARHVKADDHLITVTRAEE